MFCDDCCSIDVVPIVKVVIIVPMTGKFDNTWMIDLRKKGPNHHALNHAVSPSVSKVLIYIL